MAFARVLRKDALACVLKAEDAGARNALEAVLLESLLETSDYTAALVLAKAIEVLRETKSTEEAVRYLTEWSVGIPEIGRTHISDEMKRITENLYKSGFLGAKVNASLSLKDMDAIDMIGKQNLYWIGEHYNEALGTKFNELIRQYFDEGLSRVDFARRLKDELGAYVDKELSYWEGLADHTTSKVREMGRVRAYEEGEIEYVKVSAILDARTSRICRDMNGRIIAVKRLRAQVDDILNATTKAELMAAQRWIPSFSGKTKDLPDGVAGPPYHYRCRTTTVAYFEGVDDTGNPYQYFDGETTRKEKIAAHYADKELGRELILTDDGINHVQSRRPDIDKKKMVAALRGIRRIGESVQNPGEIITLSDNGVILIFRQNVVYTAFKPNKPLNYFKDYSTGGMKKWINRLRSIFTGQSTR
jgi:hypothetical protein